jgi:hypothetical protein
MAIHVMKRNRPEVVAEKVDTDVEMPLDVDNADEEKSGRKHHEGVSIAISETIQLKSDPYSWIVSVNGQYYYYPTLLSAFNAIFEQRVRSSKAQTLEELAADIREAQAWIRKVLVPLCRWDNGKILENLGDDFFSSVKKVGRSRA